MCVVELAAERKTERIYISCIFRILTRCENAFDVYEAHTQLPQPVRNVNDKKKPTIHLHRFRVRFSFSNAISMFPLHIVSEMCSSRIRVLVSVYTEAIIMISMHSFFFRFPIQLRELAAVVENMQLFALLWPNLFNSHLIGSFGFFRVLSKSLTQSNRMENRCNGASILTTESFYIFTKHLKRLTMLGVHQPQRN